MSSILQRLKKKEQEVLQAQSENANKDSEVSANDNNTEDLSQPTEDEGWFDKSDNAERRTKSYRLHPITVKQVAKHDLVWAKLYGFKGGTFMYFARRCSPSEGAMLEHIPMPIPPGQVLVEFIGIPTNFKAMQLVSDEDIVPFNKAPTKSKQTTLTSGFKRKNASSPSTPESSRPLEEWDADRCDAMHSHVVKKFGKKHGDIIFEESFTLAKSFLALALQNQQDSTTGNTFIDRSSPLSPISETLDMSLFAREGGAPSSPLRPGDTIEYEHKIMKKTQQSVIVSISRDKKVPLRLHNDDIVYPTDLVRKLGKENSSYRLLSEFLLEYGEIDKESLQAELARKTRRELEDIARDTGYAMIQPSKRQRSDCNDIRTPPRGIVDVDVDLSSPSEPTSVVTPQSKRKSNVKNDSCPTSRTTTSGNKKKK